MQIIILAGGEGRRLRPLTSSTPKPLVRMLGVPVIKRLLARLFTCGFKSVTIADCYLADRLESALGGFECGIELSYVRETVPLGTAGCVRQAWREGEDVLVLSGDSVLDFDFREIIRRHGRLGSDVTIVTHRVGDPREYGLVTADSSGRVTGFLEKPGYDSCLTDVANTGTYVLSSEVVSGIAEGERLDFANDVFPRLLKEGKKLYIFEEEGLWRDVGDILGFLDCQRELLEAEKKSFLVFSGAQVDKTAVISDGSVVEDGASIGRHCRIFGSCVLSGAVIGDGCSLSSSVIGENAVIGRGCVLGELSCVGRDCVIGSSVIIDRGVRIEEGIRIPSGTRVRSNVNGERLSYLEMAEGGSVTGIDMDPVSMVRLGMAGSVLYEGGFLAASQLSNSLVLDGLILGIRASGRAVIRLSGVTVGEAVYYARLKKIRYLYFLSEGGTLRLMRSDRLELSRSEERALESGYNRGELTPKEPGELIADDSYQDGYFDRIKGIIPKSVDASVSFFSKSETEKRLFDRLFEGMSHCTGENIVFFSDGEGGLFATVGDKRVINEELFILGLKSLLESGERAFILQSAPSACEEIVKDYSSDIVRVSPSESKEVSELCYDVMSLIAQVLRYLSRRKITLRAAVSELPRMCYSSSMIPVEGELPRLLANAFSKYRRDSGIVMESGGARARLQPAKSGRELRMYVEAVSTEAAQDISARIKNMVDSFLTGSSGLTS